MTTGSRPPRPWPRQAAAPVQPRTPLPSASPAWPSTAAGRPQHTRQTGKGSCCCAAVPHCRLASAVLTPPTCVQAVCSPSCRPPEPAAATLHGCCLPLPPGLSARCWAGGCGTRPARLQARPTSPSRSHCPLPHVSDGRCLLACALPLHLSSSARIMMRLVAGCATGLADLAAGLHSLPKLQWTSMCAPLTPWCWRRRGRG